MTDKEKLKTAWRTIVIILHQTGYDFMYQDEIDEVAKVIHKELDLLTKQNDCKEET